MEYLLQYILTGEFYIVFDQVYIPYILFTVFILFFSFFWSDLQVWKQKGEEYRVTGYGGWIWVSKTRVPRFVPRLPGNTNANYRKELEGEGLLLYVTGSQCCFLFLLTRFFYLRRC